MKPHQARQIRKMHKAGWSVGSIANAIQLPRGAVLSVVLGGPKPKPPAKRSKPRKRLLSEPTRAECREAEAYLELVAEGCSRRVARAHFPLATDRVIEFVRQEA